MVFGGIPFPMLTDAGGQNGNLYGVYKEAVGVEIRVRFLIDPDGVIQAMEVLTSHVQRTVAELILWVKAFQQLRKTGKSMPLGWQPGKSTLKLDPDFFGKVWKV